MRDLNLKATEAFEAVARLGTVTKAAAELAVTPSAVSQQIRVLEAQFGTRLFRREKQRLRLTLDGDRLFQTITHAFSAIRNARGAVAGQRAMRGIAIRVSPSFGVRWLGPRIADFAAANPDWAIRVDATPDFTAFETEAIDLDLRYGAGGWAGLAVHGLMRDFVLPMCAPSTLERLRGAADDAAGMLAAARLIDSTKAIYRWDIWLALNGIELPSPAYPFRFDRSSMSIELAKEGGGVALDSATLCLPELERGALVPLLPGLPVVEFPAYWLVCPSQHFNRRIVSRFSDWIAERCAGHEAAVRAVLEARGCGFREGSAADLLGP